jgi:translation initiation factor eIF-2B subunit alpha/methylthioribose-1-phosphate isomerase
MKINGKEYRSVWAEENTIKLIDQRKLPWKFEIFTAKKVEDVTFAIKDMVVRGAPAIGVAAAYGIALAVERKMDIDKAINLIASTRPTAHDLFYALEYMRREIYEGKDPWVAAENYANKIVKKCRKIGENGRILIKDGMKILTHCNAGALAAVDYGTALAPLRIAHREGVKFKVFVDETRPRVQGLLTAWELKQEGINYTLIVDNAAGYFMEKREIDLVIVGADRIAKNGDVANKIGTYEKAVVAKENNIPFYVAAPISTFDNNIESGENIEIEERDRKEILNFLGMKKFSDYFNVKNPAFDITPAKYISGYITEDGIKRSM